MKNVIDKKKQGLTLNEEDIQKAIDYVVNNDVEDKLSVEFVKTLYENKLEKKEIFFLTKAMLNSGEIWKFNKENNLFVDKHSTGGVSDSVSLVLLSLIALTPGLKMAKMSGRGLGFTGGTIDKLESFKGIKLELEKEEFFNIVKEKGSCIMSQTNNIAVADKKIYAIRDVNDYVDHIGLIASSVMSKKIATDSDVLLLDVKFGNGAFAKTLKNAKKLAKTMIMLAKMFKKNARAIITDMNSPLGNGIGCYFEIDDVLRALNNEDTKLRLLSVYFYEQILQMSKQFDAKPIRKQIKYVFKVEENGKTRAYNKFRDIIVRMGGDFDGFVNDFKALNYYTLKARKSGYIQEVDARKLAEVVRDMGGGRKVLGESILHNVGIVLLKSEGDFVFEGEEILKVYHASHCFDELILSAFEIGKEKVKNKSLIYEVIK